MEIELFLFLNLKKTVLFLCSELLLPIVVFLWEEKCGLLFIREFFSITLFFACYIWNFFSSSTQGGSSSHWNKKHRFGLISCLLVVNFLKYEYDRVDGREWSYHDVVAILKEHPPKCSVLWLLVREHSIESFFLFSFFFIWMFLD